MPSLVLLEEFHLSIRIPSNLPETKTTAICRVLLGKSFQGKLKRTLRKLFRGYRTLEEIRFEISR